MANVAFLGLGVMGFPMAGHLHKAGHNVTVYNRTASKSKKWVNEYGGTSAKTPGQAAQGADFVMACVGNDNDLQTICTGPDGAFATMHNGAIFVDHTTVSAKITRELYQLAATTGIGFVDAPVSGGQAGAENGQLGIMCGGDLFFYEKVEPIIHVYSKVCRLLGESGAGQLTKMVNQICIAGMVQSLSEGIHFAQKAGLDPKAVVEVISQGAAGSWQMLNRHETMANNSFDFGFRC